MSLTDTKVVKAGQNFDINTMMSSGLSLFVNGGVFINASGFHAAPNVVLTLTASGTNYVEMADSGVISANASAFTSGATYLYEVATSATQVTGLKDWRTSPEVDPTLNLGDAGSITSAMLASGAGIAALLTAGLGNSVTYANTKDNTTTLVAAHATKAWATLIVAVVDETFATGTGTQPTISIGETGSAAAFAPTSAFAGKAAGTVLVFAGIGSAATAITVTGTTKAGNATGSVTVTALAIPTT